MATHLFPGPRRRILEQFLPWLNEESCEDRGGLQTAVEEVH